VAFPSGIFHPMPFDTMLNNTMLHQQETAVFPHGASLLCACKGEQKAIYILCSPPRVLAEELWRCDARHIRQRISSLGFIRYSTGPSLRFTFLSIDAMQQIRLLSFCVMKNSGDVAQQLTHFVTSF
jgi:hypothetical protein